MGGWTDNLSFFIAVGGRSPSVSLKVDLSIRHLIAWLLASSDQSSEEREREEGGGESELCICKVEVTVFITQSLK